MCGIIVSSAGISLSFATKALAVHHTHHKYAYPIFIHIVSSLVMQEEIELEHDQP
jgi:hypothetical protein